jgi:hypothetical protein
MNIFYSGDPYQDYQLKKFDKEHPIGKWVTNIIAIIIFLFFLAYCFFS